MQKHRLLEQALPSLFPFSLPHPPPLFAPATQAIFDLLGQFWYFSNTLRTSNVLWVIFKDRSIWNHNGKEY